MIFMSLRSVVLFTVLAMAILMPAQAIEGGIFINIKPSSTIVDSTDDAYSARMEPISAPTGGFYFLNVTIPALYDFTLPAAGKTVGNYTMFNRTADKNQIIINITSKDPIAKTVDVIYSTNYGQTYNAGTGPITNIVIGASNLKITEPTPTTPGYLNLTLGGTAGPIKQNNNVNLRLANGILRNPNTTGDYVWYLEAKSDPTGVPYTANYVANIKNGASKAVVKPFFNGTIPAEASLPLPSGNLIVNITTSAEVSVTDLVVTLRIFTGDPIPNMKTGVESLSRFMFIGIDAPALSDVSFNATIKVNYSSALPLTIPEANLRLYRFNDLTNSWEPTVHCGVDIVNKTVCGITAGFSTFAVMGAAPSQPSSDSGGDSTGVVSTEPPENIEMYESKYGYVLAGIPATFKFTSQEHGFSEIILTSKEIQNDVTVRIEKLKGLSRNVNKPVPGAIYINVWVSARTEALMRFKVANSWIDSEGISSSSDVKMYRWDGADWAELMTTLTSKDDTYSYYEAKTAAFSHLAITGVKQKGVPTSTQEIEPISATQTPVQTTSVSGKPSGREPVSWMNILLLMLFIAFVTYVYSVARKK